MIYRAKDLLARLTHLQIWGCEDGEILWVGNDEAWAKVKKIEYEFD